MFFKSDFLHIKIDNDLLKADVKLNKGINILVGENGSGKTLFAHAIAAQNKRKNSERQTSNHWTIDDLELDNPNVKYMKYISAFALARFKNFCSNVFVSPWDLLKKFEDTCSKEGEEICFSQIVNSYGENHAIRQRNDNNFKKNCFSDSFKAYFKQNLFSILEKTSKQEAIIKDILDICDQKQIVKVKPEKHLEIWIKFYSEKYKKCLLGEENLLLYLNYCLFYYSLENFLQNEKKLVLDEKDKRKEPIQKVLNECLQKFHTTEGKFKPIDRINFLFKKSGLDFYCDIKEMLDDDSTFTKKSFKLIFYSKDSGHISKKERRFPDDFSTGEKNLVSMFDCFSWFELKKENKNIILFIDEFDAFLNPLQAKTLIDQLNQIETEVCVILVSQRPITIVQLDSKFNYLLAENKKISNSTQDRILKKLLKKTPDLNIYKSKQLHILIEGNKGSLDFRLYDQIIRTFFKTKRNCVQFLAVGEKESIEQTFKNSNSVTFSKDWLGIVDNDNEDRVLGDNLFICQKYYSVENFLFSPSILIDFLDSLNNTEVLNDIKKRQKYIEEIANKIWKKGEQIFKEKKFVKEKKELFKFIKLDKNKLITLNIFIPSFLVCAKVKDYCNIYLEWFKEKLHSKENLKDWNEKIFNQKIIENFTILPIELKKMFDDIFASPMKQKIHKQK